MPHPATEPVTNVRSRARRLLVAPGCTRPERRRSARCPRLLGAAARRVAAPRRRG